MNYEKGNYPYQGQKYRLTYPEKNAVWWSTTPTRCNPERVKECRQRKLFTPTPASCCKSTFDPYQRPNPLGCTFKKAPPLAISACQAQQMQNVRKVHNNGCLMEPSVVEYTNMPYKSVISEQRCGYQSILTLPDRNPPLPPQVEDKYSNAYDPIALTYGDPYTF